MPLRVLTCSYMIFMLLVSDGWRMGGQYIGVTLRRFGVKFQNQFKKSFPSLSREKMGKLGPRFNAGNGRVRG